MSTYPYAIDDDQVYRQLQGALNDNSLILFAGAGLSAQARTDDGRHPPPWGQLLFQMIEWCCQNNSMSEGLAADIRDLIEAGYLIEAGQELQETLDAIQLQRCLGELILCNDAQIGQAHILIAKIPFRGYLTTNYDSFIEGAIWSERGVNIQRFYERTIDGVLDFYRSRKPFIVKLHGDVDDPSSIVLGNRSYERLLYSSNNYRACLESVFATASILFIGFGGTDPDLDGIVSRVASFDGRSRRHWMLVPCGAFPPLKAKRYRQDKGINVVHYEPDGTHSGVVEFLEQLAGKPTVVSPIASQTASLESFDQAITRER